MKPSRLLSLLVVLFLALQSAGQISAAAYQEELEAIFERAIVKAQSGNGSESDLARELNQLSDLQNKYRSQRPVAAEILLTRALIYEKIIKDREMALILYAQVATEYPGTNAAYVAASTVEAAVATADDRPPSAARSRSTSGSSLANARNSAGSGTGRESTASSRNSSPAQRASGTPEVGDVFPDFSVQDLDGAPLSVSQFRGQMVLIDFWATWCGPCIEEMDNVMAAYRKHHDKGFEIIGISLDRDRAPLKNFIRARTITWPQHFDKDGALSRRFGINSIPATFLLDREGKVVAVNLRGYALERALQRHLEK